jgi:Tle cognate immunity protein 4 C-terminal domain
MLNTSSWQKVYAGRASLLLPEGTAVSFDQTEVNQVDLKRITPGPQGLEQSWLEHVDQIRRGKGEPGAQTVLTREYPGQHTVLYANEGVSGPVPERTLQHWQAYGDVFFAGETVMHLEDLPLGEQAIRDVFTAITPHAVPGPGDFALDGANVHVPLNGSETVHLSWTLMVPTKTLGTTIPVRFSLMSDTVSKPGELEILSVIPELKRVSSANGIRVTILKASKHTLAGLNGEESVLTLLDTQHPKTYSFSAGWGSAGRAYDALAPSIELTANTDSVQNIDPDVLLSYWQAISSSLRFQ